MMHVIFQVRLFAEVCIYGTMYAYIQTDRQTDTGHVQHVCVGPHTAPAQAVSIRWTGLVTGLWDWTHRKLLWVTEMTLTEYASF